MTDRVPGPDEQFGLSEYERELLDMLIWRKYRISYVEAQRSARERLLTDVQTGLDPRCTERRMMGVLRNPAARRYVRHTRETMRDAAMKRLKDVTPEVVDDYFWARQAARQASDYKETRLAAADHLDRIGVSEKPPTTTVQVAAITLRSRNFDEADLLKESPLLEGEVVAEQPTGDAEA